MKKLVFLTLVLAAASTTISAHPGRTASDGCHYCRTNCSDWGVPAGQRHCHGNSNTEQVQPFLQTTSHETSILELNTLKAVHTHELPHTHKDETDSSPNPT